MEPWLVLVRFVHYGASLVLFGLVLFPLYAYPPATSRDGASHALTISLAVSLLVLVSGIFWFIGVTTSMTEEAINWETARFVLTDTSFGAISSLRFGGAIAAAGILTLLVRGSPKTLDLLLVAICAILLGGLAGVGHTQIQDGQARAAHTLSDALHLLGAGAWLGGLVGLLNLALTPLHGKQSTDHQACEAAIRFSKIGYIAVAILAVSGLINSWFLIGSPTNLVATAYGRLLLLKLVFFAAMLAIAGVNRFLLVPTLVHSATTGAKQGLRKLVINVIAEQSLGFAIVLIVSLLGIAEPPSMS